TIQEETLDRGGGSRQGRSLVRSHPLCAEGLCDLAHRFMNRDLFEAQNNRLSGEVVAYQERLSSLLRDSGHGLGERYGLRRVVQARALDEERGGDESLKHPCSYLTGESLF